MSNYNNEDNGNNKDNNQTGINLFDKLSPQDKKLAIANIKRHWASLSPEQRLEHMDLLYSMVRQKMVEHGGMINQMDAIREFLNEDFPKSQEAAAQEVEQADYFDVARSIRNTRWGDDKFSIEIIDDGSRGRGVIEEKDRE